MGQKINPYGFRLGVTTEWKSRWFSDRDYKEYLTEDWKIRRALMQKLESAAVSRIDGDAGLAGAVGNVLQGLRWDVEEDLSRVIGDIPAHQLTQGGQKIRQELGRQAWAVAGMLAEYWLEEEPLIAKRRHLEQFSHDVDTLRDDVERLAKRLEKLEQSR